MSRFFEAQLLWGEVLLEHLRCKLDQVLSGPGLCASSEAPFEGPCGSLREALRALDQISLFLQQDCSAASVCAVSGGSLYLANHILQGTLGGALAQWQKGQLVEPAPSLPWHVPEEKPTRSQRRPRARSAYLTGPRWFPPQFEDSTPELPSLQQVHEDGKTQGVYSPRKQQRKPWEGLAGILEKAPVLDMMAKQPELLDWLEKHQDSYKEDTLEYWTMDRLANLLASEQNDTLGLMAAIDDILHSLKRRKAPDQGLLQIGFANITSYRPEVKTWVVQRPEPVWCLQETHLAGAEHERKVHELRRLKKGCPQPTGLPY